MVTISIIIPVYNVENYICRCLDSIVQQTYPDFEVLMIDDGSRDKSGDICDKYATEDARFRVFHKKNEGVSSARNLGLENARGEWITFIDADDWIDKETLEKCLENTVNVDYVRFGMKSVYADNSYVEDKRLDSNWSYEQYYAKVFARQTTLGVCGGLYLRTVFLKNNITFNTSYTLGEDWLVLIQYLKSINIVRIINDPFYNYNKQNESSVTATINVTKFIELNEVASIICHDKDLMNRFSSRDVANLKSKICGPCLANLILAKSKISVVSDIIRDMIRKKLYPSVAEVLSSCLPVKFKLILILFIPIRYYLKFNNN